MEFLSLPDDIFYYLMKYLNRVDCVSLSVSGIWPRFSSLFQENKEINLSGCYQLRPATLQSFFCDFVCPEKVKVFNLSHCYWLPTKLLVRAIKVLPELEELNVEDTRLTFNHLPHIFKQCRKISRLSVTLRQPETKKCSDCMLRIGNFSGLSSYQRNFNQLTYLKVVWHDSDIICCLIVLEILTWCLNCRDLHLEPYFDMEIPNEKELMFAQTYLFPKLRWMQNLRSFVCYHTEVRQRDETLFDALYQWISTELRFTNIQRFWYGTGRNLNITPPATIQSWHFGHKMPSIPLDQFSNLVEVGGCKFKSLPRLDKLKLADGTFSSYQVLFEFLKRQPMLEHLFVRPARKWKCQSYGSILPDQFQMPQLTTLTYICGFLDNDVLAKLISMSPNLEHVSITANMVDLSSTPVKYISDLKRLKKLSILADLTGAVTVFEKIFLKCQHLERLYLWGKHDCGPMFLDKLCNTLPLATHLRELSLTWEDHACLCRFKGVLSAARTCRKLERLHVDMIGIDVHDEEESLKLVEFVVFNVYQLKNLVALSLHLRDCSTRVQRLIKRRIKQEILPVRPSFWFSTDIYTSKVCIHNEMVCDSRVPCAYLCK